MVEFYIQYRELSQVMIGLGVVLVICLIYLAIDNGKR